MRTFARTLVNLVFLVGTAIAIGAATTLKAYQHASHNVRIAVPVVIAVAMFVLACLVLNRMIPAKKPTRPRSSFPYAAPAKRR